MLKNLHFKVEGTQGLPKLEAKPGKEGTLFMKPSIKYQAITICDGGGMAGAWRQPSSVE